MDKNKKVKKLFVLDDEAVKGLCKIARVTGKNESEVVRLLIPNRDATEACLAYLADKCQGWMDLPKLFIEAFAEKLAREMKISARVDPVGSLILQVQMVEKINPTTGIFQLYRKYIQVLQGSPKYSIQVVGTRKIGGKPFKDSAVVGPEDKISQIKKQIKSFFEGILDENY